MERHAEKRMIVKKLDQNFGGTELCELFGVRAPLNPSKEIAERLNNVPTPAQYQMCGGPYQWVVTEEDLQREKEGIIFAPEWFFIPELNGIFLGQIKNDGTTIQAMGLGILSRNNERIFGKWHGRKVDGVSMKVFYGTRIVSEEMKNMEVFLDSIDQSLM